MAKPVKSVEEQLSELKWNTRQRLQYIEIMVFYCGVLTRNDVARAFGISDPAATKDISLYGRLAPENLIYKQALFGYVPGPNFTAIVSDLSPEAVLPMIAANLTSMNGPYGDSSIFSIPAERLPIPARLPHRTITAEVLRAVAQRRKVGITYRSLSDSDHDPVRIIEPHALCHNGLRWHIRAYSEQSFDFRDFVLSRITAAQLLDEEAESDAQYDEDWAESITLLLTPHPGLSEKKRQSLLIDYGAEDGIITIEVRRALLGYLLQQLSVDTSHDSSLNPDAYQLIVANRDEVEPFAEWAFR
ncbi:WYL domain-containing protein [Solemya pervernicosa gill symbiont]|uniref:WYL domain-containing protein n=2 Tax=Gammaproteobacteria incertae sedis TaxID=118884 RepID=A0A1T2L8V0_9GAMM|nr:WYL domain-containing protein [Candidatus Reidiella endopervernicosa]OOZ41462.1 WYL domain-containing protein [Solemya pervernicosa gill symbiont]QKQ27342.1 WYL domain-containing protein [Candidatus Reidiella endopervernicosa]